MAPAAIWTRALGNGEPRATLRNLLALWRPTAARCSRCCMPGWRQVPVAAGSGQACRWCMPAGRTMPRLIRRRWAAGARPAAHRRPAHPLPHKVAGDVRCQPCRRRSAQQVLLHLARRRELVHHDHARVLAAPRRPPPACASALQRHVGAGVTTRTAVSSRRLKPGTPERRLSCGQAQGHAQPAQRRIAQLHLGCDRAHDGQAQAGAAGLGRPGRR